MTYMRSYAVFIESYDRIYMVVSKIANKSEIIEMIQFYDFGEMNSRNIPSILALGKSNLGQNGAQIKCLFAHFPFIFSKFQNNVNLKNVWDCMESLARISQIVHSFDLSTSSMKLYAHY